MFYFFLNPPQQSRILNSFAAVRFLNIKDTRQYSPCAGFWSAQHVVGRKRMESQGKRRSSLI